MCPMTTTVLLGLDSALLAKTSNVVVAADLRATEAQRHDVTRNDVRGHVQARAGTPAVPTGMVDLEGHVSTGDHTDRRTDHTHTGTSHFKRAGLADMVSETLHGDEVTVEEHQQSCPGTPASSRRRTDRGFPAGEDQRQADEGGDTERYRRPDTSKPSHAVAPCPT